MARLKIDYGIDLGTTNSAIARIENGESVIKQTRNLMDTLPSCVYFSKNKKGERSIRVGLKAKDSKYSDAITAMSHGEVAKEYGYIEFKREMGTDRKYSNDNMDKPYYTPEELSAEVLKELKSLINDEEVNSIVITIPAIFSAQAIAATKKAAEIAGFKKSVLMQEPIAACIAYNGVNQDKEGIWMVFDFGGGTFDAALVKSEEGFLRVFDTAGNPYLGGKNLDEEVINKILIPHLQKEYNIDSYTSVEWKKKTLFDALKGPAEELRIALSFDDTADYSTYDRNMNLGFDDDGEELSLDITITKEQLKEAVIGQYQKAIDICKDLLKRNNLDGENVNVILVGGPTYSPIIREMLEEQVSKHVDTSINPMTAVARGAALFAATQDAWVPGEDENKPASPTTKGMCILKLGYEGASVNPSEWISVQLDKKAMGDSCPSEITVDIERADGAWRSDKVTIDQTGNVIEVFLLPGKPSAFTIRAFDKTGSSINIQPNQFTIIPTAPPNPPLAQNVGIEVWSESKKCGVLELLKGLEKNVPLPATGVTKRTFKTPVDIRPGVESDELTIPLYQCEEVNAEGRIAAYNNLMGNIQVTGEDVDTLIPEGSSVDITVKVNEESLYTIIVEFSAYGVIVEKPLPIIAVGPEDAVKKLIPIAKSRIAILKEREEDVLKVQGELESIEAAVKSKTDLSRSLYDIQKLLRVLEDMVEATEWSSVESEIREEFDRLERAQNDLGNDKTMAIVTQLRKQVDLVIKAKDAKMGREVLEQVKALFMHLTMLYQCVGFVRHYNECFSSTQWKDASRAKSLINNALMIIGDNPTTEKLQPIVVQLIELLPPDDGPTGGFLLPNANLLRSDD